MPGLYVEIADTPWSREQGLMYRRALGVNEGMLFVFSDEQRLSFWMKDTYVPLDIAFAGSDRIIYQISDMAPLSTKSTKSIRIARYALEAPAGWFAANGVRVGGRLLTAQEYDVMPFPGLPEQQPQQQDSVPPAATFDAILNHGFQSMIKEANRYKLAVVFQYEFPEGKITTYQLVPLEDYQIVPGAEGRTLVLGRCANRDGDYRNFDIDKIINYEVYFTEGADAGKRVVMPMPQLVPQAPEPIPFEQPAVASRDAEIKTSMDKVLGMVKEAGASGGGSSGQLMMTEYWDYMKQSREEGMTEGQAVLKYLEENSRRNKGKKPNRGKKKSKKSKK